MSGITYITTSIPYVNARPHVGHALELVQADALARYRRLAGGKVRFQTGTDENAFKNVLAARAAGVGTQEFVDRNSAAFRELCEALEVAPDDFIRTTEERHRVGVEAFWRRLRAGDVYRASYRGLYCTGCEDFLLERSLVDGQCPDHAAPPQEVSEENLFFRLSAYEEQIEDAIESGRLRVIPEERRNEVLAFVRGGLQDFSVSREASRAGGWGIPVPGDRSQVIYVWVDALINYVSGLGFGSGDGWRQWWNREVCKVHVIGKNVWKFHAVYWPALLLSASLPLPDEILVHGFLTVDGHKISKSLGNAIDPIEYVEEFGANAVRHYLLSAVPPFGDGDFSTCGLVGVYEGDLANGLGNLVSRLLTLCERGSYGPYRPAPEPAVPPGYHEAFRACDYRSAAAALWEAVSSVNRDIDLVRPWELLSSADRTGLREHLSRWLTELHAIAWWLAPLLPSASQRILAALLAEPIRRTGPLFPKASKPQQLPTPAARP